MTYYCKISNFGVLLKKIVYIDFQIFYMLIEEYVTKHIYTIFSLVYLKQNFYPLLLILTIKIIEYDNQCT